jgi:hypothetical protein
MAQSQYEVTREEFEGLEWVVQTNNNVNYPRRWESMAAFNHRRVAINYAEDCKRTNPSLLYRVLELSAIQPTHAIIFETNPTKANA